MIATYAIGKGDTPLKDDLTFVTVTTLVCLWLAVIANIVALSWGHGQPPAWVTYSPLLPLAVLGGESGHGVHVAGDQRGCAAFREPGRVHLFVHVAQALWPVDHQRALELGPLEDVGGVDELHVEGRILAHEDHIHFAQRAVLGLAQGEPALGIGLDSQRNGLDRQAQSIDWQIRTAFASGCAGTIAFAWTDEWHRGGHDTLLPEGA